MTNSGNCVKCNGYINETDVVIKAFLKYAIVPQIIPRPPTRILRIKTPLNYDNVLGGFVPPFSFNLGLPSVSWTADPAALYTSVYINSDLNYILYGTYKLLYLAALTFNIPGDNPGAGDLILGYTPYLPIPGYGPERHIALIYKQPRRIVVTQNLTRSILTTNMYDFGNFVKINNLGDPLFGNLILTWFLSNDTNQDYGG